MYSIFLILCLAAFSPQKDDIHKLVMKWDDVTEANMDAYYQTCKNDSSWSDLKYSYKEIRILLRKDFLRYLKKEGKLKDRMFIIELTGAFFWMLEYRYPKIIVITQNARNKLYIKEYEPEGKPEDWKIQGVKEIEYFDLKEAVKNTVDCAKYTNNLHTDFTISYLEYIYGDTKVYSRYYNNDNVNPASILYKFLKKGWGN
jgi:hypothetical protein